MDHLSHTTPAAPNPAERAPVPVLISGAGPVGLCAAIELGLHGIECVLVEPRREPTRLRPRAKTLNTRTMEHFRRWGLAKELRSRAPLPTSWSQDVAFTTTFLGREITRFSGVLGLRDDDGASPELGQQMPQYVMEDLLREIVAAMPTCTFHLGSRVTALTAAADHDPSDQEPSGPDSPGPGSAVTVTVQDEDGSSRLIRAEYVIGADGARSLVREAIGSAYEGTQALRPNVGVVFRSDTLTERAPHAPAVQSWLINDRVPGLFGPVDRRGTWWLIAFGVDGTSPDLDPVALVHGALGEELPVEIVSTDPWTARMELADVHRRGRVFLIGDAAHLNPPFGGHGLNTGIGDAVDVGWKLAAVLNGWGGLALLDSYEAERRDLHRKVIDEAAANMRTLSTHFLGADLDASGPEAESTRAAVAKEIHATKRREYFSLNLVLGHRYENSPVLPAARPEGEATNTDDHWATQVRTGRRLPHAWLAEGVSTLDQVGSGYTALVLGDAHMDRLEAAAHTAGLPLKIARWPGAGALAASLGASVVVVRPDQVVAWHGTEAPSDPTALVAVLSGARVSDNDTSHGHACAVSS